MCTHATSRRSAHAFGAALFASVTLAVVAACHSDNATGLRGAARVVIVSGDSQTAQVGTQLPEPLVVKVLDSLGAPAVRLVVRFGGFGSPVQDSALTDARGIASLRWTLGEISGTQFLQATATVHGAMKAATFRATATPGPPARIVISRGEGAVAVTSSQLDTIVVVLLDRFSNLLSASPLTWSVTAGGGTVRALGTQTDIRGAARATWTLGPAAGIQTLTVSAGDVIQPVVAHARSPFVAADVVVGGSHSCALTSDGTAYCWGSNAFAQLGAGPSDGAGHRIPVAVARGLRFKSIVAGRNHSCGLTVAGDAYCWGDNESKQVSNIGSPLVTSPVLVLGAPAFTMLAAGAHHTCGLTPAGEVFCWGDNALGQLGNGADRSKAAPLGELPVAPTRVAGSLTFATIAAADYITCGITTAGETRCWGANWDRALGTDAVGSCVLLQWDFYYYYEEEAHIPCSTSPARVGMSAVLTSLSATSSGVCGVSTMSELLCWGNGLIPRTIPGANVVRAWRLASAVCAQDAGGTVACWTLSAVPAPVRPFGENLTLVNLTTSRGHSCGLTRDAAAIVYCWGENSSGQLGDGTAVKRALPVPVATPLAANTSRAP